MQGYLHADIVGNDFGLRGFVFENIDHLIVQAFRGEGRHFIFVSKVP